VSLRAGMAINIHYKDAPVASFFYHAGGWCSGKAETCFRVPCMSRGAQHFPEGHKNAGSQIVNIQGNDSVLKITDQCIKERS
jgi:hypothetical protein